MSIKKRQKIVDRFNDPHVSSKLWLAFKYIDIDTGMDTDTVDMDTDTDTDIVSLFYLYNTLGYGNGASYRLDQQNLQDAPASLQVHQENKITLKVKMYAWLVLHLN